MHGFSERVSDLEVGHLLGLRWFELADAGGWRCTELSYASEMTDVLELGSPVSISLPTGVTVSCSCGASVASVAAYGSRTGELERFIKEHDPRAARTGEPVLKGAQAEWQPGENVAVCRAGQAHMVPTERCGCGYWAYWSLGQKMVSEPAVVGIVKGYGDTIEGDKGFRTSHAKIIAVYLPHWDTAAALALEERYQVDLYCSLGAMLLRHKAPEGQRPLRDNYYTHGIIGDIPGAQPSVHSGHGGMKLGESYLDYARRIGLADPLAPCARCGQVSCGTGQAFCNNCRALEAHEASKAQTLSGYEAQAKLHERREGWASGSTFTMNYTGGVTAPGGGGGGSAGAVSGGGYTSGGNGRSSSFGFQLS